MGNIIIFTTKIIGKPENFFNKKIYRDVFDEDTEIKKHALTDNYLLKPYNVEDIKKYIENKFAELNETKQKEIAKIIIAEKRGVEPYFNLYFDKNFTFEDLFNISDVKNKLISYFEKEVENEKVIKLIEQLKSDDFKTRKHIYGIEDNDIYAYRCLDFDYLNEVFTPQARNGFIDAVITDIAIGIKEYDSLEKFIEKNTIYLIIHEDDIKFKKTTKQLSAEEIEEFLFEYNPKIGKVVKDKIKDETDNYEKYIKCYVFQHTSGIFVDILNNKLDKVLALPISNNISLVDNLITEINKYFKLRANYKELERKGFRNPNLINNIKKNMDDLIYKELGDNQKLF